MEKLLGLEMNKVATFKKGEEEFHIYSAPYEEYILITEEGMQVFGFDDVVELIEGEELTFDSYKEYKDIIK